MRALSKDTKFQSTLPVRGATPHPELVSGCHPISIHAPREGSDFMVSRPLMVKIISIHAPREGSDSNTSGMRFLR